MTLNEFKTRLTEEHAGQFNLSRDGYIRHKTIRITSEPACPLAVIFGESYFDWSAKSGMSWDDATKIVNTADRRSHRYNNALRRWMLETLCT